MLSAKDNELLCRVGPGTPMGNVFRQYWIPAIRSDELPAPDCPPLRVKLLGEELIGFRTTSGEVGLMQNACPHRGASLFFGRNEEEGLRCVYHGWKFDVTGACVDMPSEPAESQLQEQGAARRPTRRTSATASSGPTWARAKCRRRCRTSKRTCSTRTRRRSASSHRAEQLDAGHRGRAGHDPRRLPALRLGDARGPGAGQLQLLPLQRSAPARSSSRDTDFGSGVRRLPPGGGRHATTGASATCSSRSTRCRRRATLGADVKMNAYVPMDDEHTLQWEIFVRTDGAACRGATCRSTAAPAGAEEAAGVHPRRVPAADAPDWYGRFNLDQNLANDYMIDREAQATGTSATPASPASASRTWR